MNNLKIVSILLLSVILLQSCEQETSGLVETKTTIVEGYLFAGQSIDSFKVTQSFSYEQVEDEIIPIDGLDIVISEGGNDFPLTSIGNGYYQNSSLIIASDRDYQVSFDRNGETISAETYIPEYRPATLSTTEVEVEQMIGGGPPAGDPDDLPEPIEITWDNEDGDYYYVLITNIEDDPEYVNLDDDQTGGRFVLLTEPQISDFYAIDARRELSQYGTHQVIVYHVNAEYAALYESSGNSTLSLVEPNTNIENGLGIFTGVSSDTLYLEVINN